MQQQLKQFRIKLKDSQALKQRLAQDERRIEQLKDEITKSKQQKVQLQQKMKARADSYSQWIKEKDDKVKSLTRASRKNQVLVRVVYRRF